MSMSVVRRAARERIEGAEHVSLGTRAILENIPFFLAILTVCLKYKCDVESITFGLVGELEFLIPHKDKLTELDRTHRDSDNQDCDFVW
jgi:hypothetical protein